MPSTPSSIAPGLRSDQIETVAASVLAPVDRSLAGGRRGGGLLGTNQPVQGVDISVGGRLDDVERGGPPDHHLRSLAEGDDGLTERVAALGGRGQTEILELGRHTGDLLDGAENRIERPVAAGATRAYGALIADGNFGGAGDATLCVDLDVLQGEAARRRPSERLLDRELQVL